MGRPSTELLGTLPVGRLEAIVLMRRTRPGWEPTTLLAELRVDARIAALLSAEKLTRRYQKHSELPVPVIQPEGDPHDEWELDAL